MMFLGSWVIVCVRVVLLIYNELTFVTLSLASFLSFYLDDDSCPVPTHDFWRVPQEQLEAEHHVVRGGARINALYLHSLLYFFIGKKKE